MKYITVALIGLLSHLFVTAQDTVKRSFFETKVHWSYYCADIRNDVAWVYKLGRYLEKAGSGSGFQSTDSLVKQPDGSYMGSTSSIVKDNNKYYLLTGGKKIKRRALYAARDTVINTMLNNAYYLDGYFRMSDAVDKLYPLNNHASWIGFSAWKALPDKDIDYVQFKTIADKEIKKVKDSICKVQSVYVALSDHIFQNIYSIAYDTLKNSLVRLPAEILYPTKYFYNVVSEVAKQKPAYFFALAEDLPEMRELIFGVVQFNKKVRQGLREVEGHDEIKNTFFRRKK